MSLARARGERRQAARETPPPTARAALGVAAERAAADYLGAHGYQIVESNYRCRAGEIDLVAEDADGVLCFVEVRARTRGPHDFGRPVETIGPRKQQRVVRAAEHYLWHRGIDESRAMRFDVVGVVVEDGAVTLELVRDAFASN